MFISKLLRMDSGQTFSCMYYHIIWSTKSKTPYITNEYKKILYKYIQKTLEEYKWILFAIGGTPDHVHMLIQKKPSGKIPNIICQIKANSSKFVRDNFDKDFVWQKGYSIFTVDITSFDRIQKYIINQEKHHKQMSFDKEYELIVKKYKK